MILSKQTEAITWLRSYFLGLETLLIGKVTYTYYYLEMFMVKCDTGWQKWKYIGQSLKRINQMKLGLSSQRTSLRTSLN